jgi:hypothetical protein
MSSMASMLSVEMPPLPLMDAQAPLKEGAAEPALGEPGATALEHPADDPET